MKLKKTIIKYSPTFFRQLRKFPKSHLRFLAKKEELFRQNPLHPSLKTHKLKGELAHSYSFSISYHWRIVFHFEDEQTVIFDAIGTHEVYR